MVQIYQSAFLKALGWSLVNSLWQMSILWLLYICLTANGRLFGPNRRHALALLSLFGGCLWFITDLVMNLYQPSSGNTYGIGWLLLHRLADQVFLSPPMDSITPVFSLAYLVMLVFLFSRFLLRYGQNQRLAHAHFLEPDHSLQLFLEGLIQQLGIKKEVGLWLSDTVDTPLTIGFWKPLILLPVAVLNQLSIRQTEAIILHELYHIKRNDYLVNLVISFVNIFLFFNPFARILAGIINKERENSCDDKVLQFAFDPYDYAHALLQLEKQRSFNNPVSIAATGGGQGLLLNRVKRILKQKPASPPVLLKLAGCLLFIFLAGSSGTWTRSGFLTANHNNAPSTTANAVDSNNYIIQVSAPVPVPAQPVSVPVPPPAPVSIKEKKRGKEKQPGAAAPLHQLVRQVETVIIEEEPVSPEQQEQPAQLTSYISNKTEEVAYALADHDMIYATKTPAAIEALPYVPRSSFVYHSIEQPLKTKTAVRVIHHENGRKEIIIETYFTEPVKGNAEAFRGGTEPKIKPDSGRKTRKIVHI